MRTLTVYPGMNEINLYPGESVIGCEPVTTSNFVNIIVQEAYLTPAGEMIKLRIYVRVSDAIDTRPNLHMEFIGACTKVFTNIKVRLKEEYSGSDKMMVESHADTMMVMTYVVFLINEETDE
jgi:hypothetical protein